MEWGRALFFLAAVALAAAVGLLASQLFAPKPSAVYLRPGLEVYAGPSPDGAARLVLEVYDREGRPVDFSAVLVGPTAGGFAEVGRARGRGRAVLPLDSYVAETAALARALGHEGEDVRFGLLAIVTRARLENDTAIFETAFAAIPIGPRERGKEVTARLVFNPIHSRAVKLNTGETTPRGAQTQSSGQGVQAWPSRIEGRRGGLSGGNAPPQYMEPNCVPVITTPENMGLLQYCAAWNLTGYLPRRPSEARAGLPLLTTYITPRDAESLESVDHSHSIKVSQTSTFAITLSLQIKDQTVIAGDAYQRTSTQEEVLLSLGCTFRSQRSIYDTGCEGLNFREKFGANSLLMTGMEGYLYLVNYTYVEYYNYTYAEYRGNKLVFKSNITVEYVGDTGTGVYFFPVERGRGYVPWAQIARLDSDAVTAMAFQRLLAVTRPVWLNSSYGRVEQIDLSNIVISEQNIKYLSDNIPVSLVMLRFARHPAGIPATILIQLLLNASLGIDISRTTREVYAAYAIAKANAFNNTWFMPYYLRYGREFRIWSSGELVPTPLAVWSPNTGGAVCPREASAYLTTNNTADMRPQGVYLKVFDIQPYWSGRSSVWVRAAPGTGWTFSPSLNSTADYALFWEDCTSCEGVVEDPSPYATRGPYEDEIVRVSYVDGSWVVSQLHHSGAYDHEIRLYVNGTLARTLYHWGGTSGGGLTVALSAGRPGVLTVELVAYGPYATKARIDISPPGTLPPRCGP